MKGERGTIEAMRPSRDEFKDRIMRDGAGGLEFRFHTKGHVDGFDVKASGCLEFHLQLDAGPPPQRVFVGAGMVSPRSNHFVLCPKG